LNKKKTRNVTWFLNYNILQKKNYTIEQKEKSKKTYWMELLNKLKRQTFRVLFCCHMVSFLLERKTKYKRPNSNKKYLLNAAWPKKTLKK